MTVPAHDVEIDTELKRFTREEALATFDARVRRHLNISGEEFIKRWNAGCYDGPEDTDVTAVMFLLPIVGIDPTTKR